MLGDIKNHVGPDRDTIFLWHKFALDFFLRFESVTVMVCKLFAMFCCKKVVLSLLPTSIDR